ncbi:cytochrome c biogenesis protein [Leptolyngbya sp. FACHB-261]|uniref:cytochrome c biogenesis protein n=1 Tax=Leptolyngbya sp. FACHB-261 TaxID=2692806 RepID=UPI0016897CF9|nr:cytochrome c biogenesis protein [Leptolyngbya sp. FACHB-261]MBD2099550.1 cytochrome c biogenesis protein [Leptolyngbya sp. FACHB-261]
MTELRRFFKHEVLPLLANLKLAIALLLTIALFSVLGTVIEQGQTLEFYQTNYPENPALFGFLTWKLLLTLGLDHVYRTWWFLTLLILFSSSLVSCTFTRQFPMLKAAKRWSYYTKPQSFRKLALSTELPGARLGDLQTRLASARYQIFSEDGKLYARKGMIGRIGPIVVHASMLLILVGALWGAFTGFQAQQMVPSGATFKITNITEAGPWASPQFPKDWSVHVNRFWIDYTPKGSIDQFYSDLSVLDLNGQEVMRKTIHVNEPLRYHGVTLYQADWSVAGIRAQVNNSPLFQLPMVPIQAANGSRLWGTWMPINFELNQGITLLTPDLQGTLIVYGPDGQLLTTTRVGMPTELAIAGIDKPVRITVRDVVGATGLQIKADPGIPTVYAGFGLLMLGVMMSYVSHSQVWALQEGERLYVGGRTNRAQVAFERELVALLSQVEQPQTVVRTAPAAQMPILQ